MIKLGVCTDIGNIQTLEKIGFDYLEGNLAALEAMDEAEYAAACALVDAASIKVEACNCLLPGTLKVVGKRVRKQALADYLDKALARAERLGVRVVVFGSGRSRGVPEGFDIAKAWRQVAAFLRLLSKKAAEHGIDVAIEPLHAAECNLLNYVSEAVLLSSLLRLDNVRALGDTYHMALGAEPLSALELAGARLAHIHAADNGTRAYPTPERRAEYAALFSALRAAGYQGRVSIEGRCENFAAEAESALRVLADARDAAC